MGTPRKFQSEEERREAKREARRKWRAEHPEAERAHARKATKAYRERSRKTLEGTAKLLANNMRQRARNKGLEIGIDADWIVETARKQGERCAFSQIPFVYTNEPNHPHQLSLDRTDSSLGYTPDNVKIVVLMYNHCKNTCSYAQVLHFAEEIVRFSGNI